MARPQERARRRFDALHRSLVWMCGLTALSLCASCSGPTDDDSGAPAGSVQQPAQPLEAKKADRVLRHAVFFKFKDSSTEEQVGQVVEAFRALPSKINEIAEFQWGVNNSPEGLNDGLTHCFLLTFNDEQARSEYLPHNAHKAFGDVLRPHMEKVFVIDYWGTPQAERLEKELKHAVFVKFKDDADPAAVAAVEEAFAELPSKIDAIRRFEWGTNNSPEKHDEQFTHCFMISFDSEEGRAAYLPHADHQALVEILKPVLDKVRVLDFWAAP